MTTQSVSFDGSVFSPRSNYVGASCAEISRAAGATRLLSHPVEAYLKHLALFFMKNELTTIRIEQY
jgi:hypothetical protein